MPPLQPGSLCFRALTHISVVNRLGVVKPMWMALNCLISIRQLLPFRSPPFFPVVHTPIQTQSFHHSFQSLPVSPSCNCADCSKMAAAEHWCPMRGLFTPSLLQAEWRRGAKSGRESWGRVRLDLCISLQRMHESKLRFLRPVQQHGRGGGGIEVQGALTLQQIYVCCQVNIYALTVGNKNWRWVRGVLYIPDCFFLTLHFFFKKNKYPASQHLLISHWREESGLKVGEQWLFEGVWSVASAHAAELCSGCMCALMSLKQEKKKKTPRVLQSSSSSSWLL